MNLNHKELERTGRTIRMLAYALDRAKQGLYTTVLGASLSHANTLRQQFEKLPPLVRLKEEEMLRLSSFVSMGSLIAAVRSNDYGISRFYDYGTNTFRHDAPIVMEIVIDHYALEQHLVAPIRYLRAAAKVRAPQQWMIDSARMTSAIGHRVYLVSEDKEFRAHAEHELEGCNVSVEDTKHLSNLNLLRMCLEDAHSRAVLPVDPRLVESTFRGALNEINRWDLK